MNKRISILLDDDEKRKYIPPEPNERFLYIYVKKPDIINFDGKVEKEKNLSGYMEYPCYLEDYKADINYDVYFESDLAGELGSLVTEDSSEGKKFMIKLFDLIMTNINYQDKLDEIKYLSFDELKEYKNDIKIMKKKEIKNIIKDKSIFYSNIKNILLEDYPLLLKFDIVDNPQSFIDNINNQVTKINFDNSNEIKSSICDKIKDNKYYSPDLTELFNCINIKFKVLTEEIEILLSLYYEGIYIEMRNNIKNHCNNIEEIVDFNEKESLDNLKKFVNNYSELLQNIEKITKDYYNSLIKINRFKSYPKFINKLKFND